MDTNRIDRTADVLSALKSACELSGKKDIVIMVLESVRNGFSNINPNMNAQKTQEPVMINLDELVQVMNMYINELKSNK